MRELREESGLPQEKLAGLVERGGANPTLLAIMALSRALKVRPSKLLEKLR